MPAPALRGRRGSQLRHPQPVHRHGRDQHRPFGVGEDRNQFPACPSLPGHGSQHRPFGVGEDRNGYRGGGIRGAARPAPALRGRRGSQPVYLCDLRLVQRDQHRPFGVGEDRNPKPSCWTCGRDGASTGPSGSARIATMSCAEAVICASVTSTGPSGSARIATPAPSAQQPAPRLPAPALRGRRGSQPRPHGAVHRGHVSSTGPSGSARIATLLVVQAVHTEVLDQHRPFGVGEDRNVFTGMRGPGAVRTSTGPSGSARIATSGSAPTGPRGSLPAPALRGRRGSQRCPA